MNLREGRVGRQESVAAAAIALASSGLFAADKGTGMQSGNSAYLYLPAALLLALAAFLLTGAAMKRSGTENLAELNYFALGVGASAAGALLSLLFCYASAAVTACFAELLHRYVFMDAGYPVLVFYCALPPFLMAWRGLECIARTAKIFAWTLAAAMAAELIVSAGGYEVYRMFPILGRGVVPLIRNAGAGVCLFLPALAALWVCGSGVQGRKNARRYGVVAAAVAGTVVAAASIAVALTFSYQDAEEVFSPLFRMSLLGSADRYRARLDSILLFLWMAGGMIACAFYNYAASLMFARSFRQQDVRPAAGTFSFLSAGMTLLHTAEAKLDIMTLAARYAPAGFTFLLLLPAAAAFCKRPAEGRKK